MVSEFEMTLIRYINNAASRADWLLARTYHNMLIYYRNEKSPAVEG